MTNAPSTVVRHLAAGIATLLWIALGGSDVAAQGATSADSAEAAETFRELVQIPSVSGTPATVDAARALARRLRAAGFPEEDVTVAEPASGAGTLVARYHGSGDAAPILLLAHLDVVPAAREDWSLDPFVLTEREGWWYGRGTTDNKAGAAILVANLVRWRRAGWTPERDLVMVLTGDEETNSEAIRWAVEGEGRRLVGDPTFALNTDAGGGTLAGDRELTFDVQASEKVYLSYRLEVTNRGGHSSVPRPDNAILSLADALVRVGGHRFPVVLNEVSRAFLARSAEVEADPARAADMRAVADRADSAAAERLSAEPHLNALLRTTCVPTQLEAGHAENALPQTARATVNCRILPTEEIDAVDRALASVVADSSVRIARVKEPTPSPPSPLTPEVLGPIEAIAAAMWPDVPVVPQMSAGATDGLYVRNAGIPVYGVSAIFQDPADERAHGRDERIEIRRFYESLEYWRRLLEALAGPD